MTAATSPAAPMEFEADLEPGTGFPRVRFNFDNGWSASLLLRFGPGSTSGMLASVAACPTGEWGTGRTILGPTEAYADEAVRWIDAIRARPPLEGTSLERAA